MYKIVAIIEKGPDGRFAITSSQSFGKNHFGGFGETIEEAKADFRESVQDCRDLAIADGEKVSEEYVCLDWHSAHNRALSGSIIVFYLFKKIAFSLIRNS